MNNHPNNHPLYQTLGNPPNIQLLDTMFQMQPTGEVHKPATIIPAQYAYTADMQLAAPSHQAVNLAQAHVTASNELATGQPVIIYQQAEQPQQQQQQPISYKIPQMGQTVAGTAPVASTLTVSRTTASEEQKKKDIVAEATSKIFDEGAVAKKSAPVPVTQSATPSGNPPATAIKSEPTPGTSKDVSPSKTVVRTGGPVSVGRPRGGGRHLQRQQILPRLQLLEDEDDGLTCRMCLQSFWYKSALIDHLKSSHSISDPERYEREEREKKMRRIREEQQRQILAKRQRLAASHGKGGFKGRLGAGRPTLGKPVTGPRPSFQYRDGAFICDLCKKSFSDGNDMVTHWKSHVKKQRLQGGFKGRPGRSLYEAPRGVGLGRADKGKPRWTAYLVWSTRRRKEISEEEPDYSFGEVAKTISAEWKEISEDEKDKYQVQADKMNAAGVRKMFKAKPVEKDYYGGPDSDIDWSADEDPDFEEKIVKPIMLKIKKEQGDEDDGKPRSNRKRKRPSFFQEFENEENNLDKILDEFEQEQMEEAKKPKPEKKATPKTGTAPRRRRKREPSVEPEPEEEEEIELEKSRSGRIRKKPKFYNYFHDPEGDKSEDEDDEEDKDEYQPPEEDEEEENEDEIPDEEVVDSNESTSDSDSDTSDSLAGLALPPKKRGRSKKIMSEAEIEEFARRALEAKTEGDDSEDDTESDEEEDTEEPPPAKTLSVTISKVLPDGSTEEPEDAEKAETSTEGINEESNKESTAESVPSEQEQPKETPEEEEQESEAAQEQDAESTAEVPDVSEPTATDLAEAEPVAAESIAPEPVVSEPAASEPAAPESATGEEDLLTQMEQGDDKFKDIIAEGQMDQIFQ